MTLRGGGASALYREAYATPLLRRCWSRVSPQVGRAGGHASTCFTQAIMSLLFSTCAGLQVALKFDFLQGLLEPVGCLRRAKATLTDNSRRAITPPTAIPGLSSQRGRYRKYPSIERSVMPERTQIPNGARYLSTEISQFLSILETFS